MPHDFPAWPSKSKRIAAPSRRPRQRAFETCEPRFALSAAGLVVTEIMYHPPAPSAAETAAGFTESDFDFIELQNAGPTSIDLTGAELKEGVEFQFTSGTLAPGEFIVVVADTAAFAMRYGSGINVAGAFSGSLANGGEELLLEDVNGDELLRFTFDDGWQPATDGDGRSLVIVNPFGSPAQWEQPTSWTSSAAIFGSPGRSEGLSDDTPPTAPANLVASPGGAGVLLTWSAASDPETGVTSYRVYRDGRMVGSTALTTFTDPAPANATYEYYVQAVNGASMTSGPSNEASVTLPYVGESPAFAPAQTIAAVTLPGRETSGIAASQRNPGVFYVHNDGAQNRLFAINAQGQVLGTITLSGVTTIDTEDIAVGPGPAPGESYIYLGDVGDNDSNRANVSVIRIREPLINPTGGNQSQTLGPDQHDTIRFTYPFAPTDAEAIMVDPLNGDFYVLSKEGPTSRLYRAAAASLIENATVPLAQVGNVNFGRPSAASISPLGHEILVRDEDRVRLYQRAEGQTVAAALATQPIIVPVVGTPTEPNGEGITFDAAGNNYYTISEGRDPPLHYFHRTSRSPSQSTPTLEGDLNGDNRVGIADLMVIQRNLGIASGATAAQGDLDGNGAVNRADVARFAQLFGSADASQSPAAAEASALTASVSATRTLTRSTTRRSNHVSAARNALDASAVDRAMATSATLETSKSTRRVGRTK